MARGREPHSHALPHPPEGLKHLMLQLSSIVTSRALNLENSLRRISFPLSGFPFLREGQGNKEQDSQVLIQRASGDARQDSCRSSGVTCQDGGHGGQLPHCAQELVSSTVPALPELTCHTVCWLGSEAFTEAPAPYPRPLPRASASR